MVLDKQLLVEALSGRISLQEYHTMGSTGAGGSIGPGNPNVTNRAEQLDITWRDMMSKMEALWSIDIMNAAPELYDKAASALDEIRNLDPSACRAAATNFKQITQLLAQASKSDEFADEKDLKLYMARQEELNAELEYVCDEFDPDLPRPPEQPVKSREQWIKAQSKDKKHGIDPPTKDNVGSDLGIDNALPSADVPPERTFVPDRSTLGKDQAGKSNSNSNSNQNSNSGNNSGKKNAKNAKKTQTKAEKPKKKTGKKPVKESQLKQADACPSVVMASLAEAAESPDEREAVFLQAGDAIRACLEAYTDVDSAYVEIGQAVPGYKPRLDLYTEWTINGKPSPCLGYARLHLDENEGLVVMGSDDRTKDVLRFDEEETDEAIAWRLYHALDEVYDASPRATWEENRVVPALYRLLEKGPVHPPEVFRQVLSGLNGFVALHEAVGQPSTSVAVVQEQGFEDVYAYHYAWAVNTPLSHAQLPDEISPHKDTMDDPPPEDEEAAGQVGDKDAYIGGAPIKDEGGTDHEDAHWQFALFGEALDEFLQDPDLDEKYRSYLQSKRERLEGGHTAYWRTPSVLINLKEGTVKIRHRDGHEEPVGPDAKDEDITAKLATYAFQKESIETARLIEYFDRERLSLDLIPGMKKTYLVRYRGKILGSVKSDGRKWGVSVRKRGPWKDFLYMTGYAAGQALAKSQGIHERKVDRRLIKKLNGMDVSDLYRTAEIMGIKVRGDGVTYDRQKLQSYILAAATGDPDPCNLPAQVGFEENVTPEAALIAACEAVEMKMDLRTAKSWVEQHWKEYL